MVTPKYVPDLGHLIWIDFDPSTGHEQAGRRPAIVLSPATYNAKTNLAIVAPITNRKKGYPFEVELPPKLRITGVVLPDHLKNLDWTQRRAAFAGAAPRETIVAVQEKLALLFGMSADR